MDTYQFEPRAHITYIDTGKALRSAASGGHNGRLADPTMYELHPIKNTPIREWEGINQPVTVKFEAADDDTARHIQYLYGEDDAFVWNVTKRHYVGLKG